MTIAPDDEELYDFVLESNKIEGIYREPRPAELEVSAAFLGLRVVGIADLERFVDVCAGARLRREPGMDVTVGTHRPPPGGKSLERLLQVLLDLMPRHHPFGTHVQYESLHPFMDGNGRSGRILWAHQMLQHDIEPGIRLGFLHAWYYQSLEFVQHRPDPDFDRPVWGRRK